MVKKLVLLHGILGFGNIKPFGITIANYFRDLVDSIDQTKLKIITPEANPVASVNTRAGEFASQIIANSEETDELYLIAHSMGGLDIRVALQNNPALQKRVKAVVTVGTPHQGSEVAEVLTSGLIGKNFADILQIFPSDLTGVLDLRPDRCAERNSYVIENIQILSHIKFYTIAGNPTLTGGDFSKMFRLAARIGGINQIPNDGVVTVQSATYQSPPWNNLPDWPVDHAGLIGWFELSIFDIFTGRQKKAYRNHIERYHALIELITEISRQEFKK